MQVAAGKKKKGVEKKICIKNGVKHLISSYDILKIFLGYYIKWVTTSKT